MSIEIKDYKLCEMLLDFLENQSGYRSKALLGAYRIISF